MMTYKHLGDDNPELGLFFVQEGNYPQNPDESSVATGIAFLVGEHGLLVTCSHVVLGLDAIPGTRVKVYGASPDLPVTVEALVLDSGWCGPEWREMDLPDGAKRISELVDYRPDSFREDVAFLQLCPETASFDSIRTEIEPIDGAKLLLEGTRVLPLGSPGYRHGSGVMLKAWHVKWELSAPYMASGDGTFASAEPGLRNVIRFRSKDIRPGFSGSPLWDGERRRVVGMVRRGVSTVPDTVLGVDARFIARTMDLPLVPDETAEALFRVAERVAENAAPMRHFPLLRGLLPPHLLDLRARVLEATDEMAPKIESLPAHSAVELVIDLLKHEAVVLLQGVVGTGKSTLLYRIAVELLRKPVVVNDHRLVPFPINATDFVRLGYDVVTLLNEQRQHYSYGGPDGQTLAAAIDCNDLALVLLLDGLDELERSERAKIVSRLAGVRVGGKTPHVVVATRPTDDIEIGPDGRTRNGWPIANVEHLDTRDVERLAAIWFENDDEQRRFTNLLAELTWDQRNPTPLQAAIIKNIFQSPAGIPERPIDLPFRFVDHLIALGAEEVKKLPRFVKPSHAQQFYMDRLRSILRFFGHLTIDGRDTKKSIAEALSFCTASWAKDPGEVIDFIEREHVLLGGILTRESGDDEGWKIRWPHRSVAEALAAEYLTLENVKRPIDGLNGFKTAIRQQGQSYGLLILAALDQNEIGRIAVELALSQAVAASAADYKSSVLTMRALAAGIRTGEDLRRKLIKKLLELMLLLGGFHPQRARCEALFNSDVLPDLAEIANRPAIRPIVVEQFNDRLRRRPLGLKEASDSLTVSKREAELLDRLSLWGDLEISVRPPVATAPRSTMSRRMPLERTGMASPVLTAAVLARIVHRLEHDTGGFLTELAEFLRTDAAHLETSSAAEAYVARLLQRVAQTEEP